MKRVTCCGIGAVLCAGAQVRHMNVNRATQTKWNVDNEAVSQKRTDYDFDKEQWLKQMKFASMDCIMDPDINSIKYSSFAGLKKALKRWLTMKKLMERRPDFKLDSLRDLFIQFKKVSCSRSLDEVRVLQRITTHNETNRIMKDIQSRLNDEFAKKSWKALKLSTNSGKVDESYEIQIDSFELVNCYMGQMSQEDWLQITVRCVFRQRHEGGEWETCTEYPVFEVRLGDGIKTANNHPFIVVGVMRKDGTRYGKDAQDAATLRKQFDRSGSWF
mmetsp:Transcript_56701/g.64979  ORF Transcript_56701/g.64979 Transcript_56701/m.64979 type:complete len:273 (+) Transcript_56701:41-859(+)